MARSILGNIQYPPWAAEWTWREYYGRSLSRWGSPNNYAGGASTEPNDLRMTYNPGQNVYSCGFKCLMRRYRAAMGFRALVLSARFRIRQGSDGTGAFDTRLHEYLKPYPDLSDMTMQYKDATATLEWYLGGYAAQYGADISTNPIATASLIQNTGGFGDFFSNHFEIRDYFAKQLLNNDDLIFEAFQVSSSSTLFFGTDALGEEFTLDVYYLHPVEMYPLAAVGGGADFTRLLNTDNEPINLGAYQQGQTSAAQKFFLKNFSRQTIAHLEIWDDFPEWSEPEPHTDNGGSGDLAYVTPFEDCVSQRWEIKFDVASSTDFEIKATAYGDNIESLHGQYDADGDWQGDTSTDWSSPGGEIEIPAAAWSGTPSGEDVFTFFTRGNTTNTIWPADSNDQVEMCDDSGGSPSGDWRPINAQRTLASAGVTIDAATKVVSVKRIDTSKWGIGDPVFIADDTNIDIGTINTTTATSITIEGLAVTSNVYAAGAIVATTLPIRALTAATWGELSAASGVSESNPDRLYIDDPSSLGFSGGQDVFIQSNSNPQLYETRTIDTVYSTYLLLTANLENDYEVGDTVLEDGSGEAVFWLRVVAGASTVEELKQFRLSTLA